MAKCDYTKANFVWSLDTETERVLHTAYKTSTGFYLSKGFYVLDHRIDKDASCVYLPKIDFKSYPEFWNRIKLAEDQIPLENVPTKIREFIRESISPILKMDVTVQNRLEKSWLKIEKEFWSTVTYLFPACFDEISELEVWITSFGTLSSYSHLSSKNQNKMIAYVREDFGIEQLAEAIITTLYLKKYDYSSEHWELSEGVSDFLLTTSGLSKLLPKYIPTLENLKIDNSKLIQCKDYLSILGVPPPLNLGIKNEQLFAGTEIIEQKFSKDQAMILKLLINRKGQIVTYDDIADIIWSQENADKYSTWAINKHIQRIKAKIASMNIYSINIMPVRSRGYMIV